MRRRERLRDPPPALGFHQRLRLGLAPWSFAPYCRGVEQPTCQVAPYRFVQLGQQKGRVQRSSVGAGGGIRDQPGIIPHLARRKPRVQSGTEESRRSLSFDSRGNYSGWSDTSGGTSVANCISRRQLAPL